MSSNQEKPQSEGGHVKDVHEDPRDNSGRSRSRSNGRKRSYNAPQQSASQQSNDMTKNARYTQDDLTSLQKLNMNQGLQQLQDMANKKGDAMLMQ